MKDGPDAGAGANLTPLLRTRRVMRVGPALTAVLKPRNVGSVTGNPGRRKPREHEVTGILDVAVYWPLVRVHVILPGERAD